MRKRNWNNGWKYLQDGKMKDVHLPHDAMMASGREADAPSGNSGAYYKGGEYIYTKLFECTKEMKDKSCQIQFDGIYQNARIYLNDKQIGKNFYGYVPFLVKLDGFLQSGMNQLQVRADNREQPNSRWYSGGGLYRSVWMWEGNKSHIEPFGIKIVTTSLNPVKIRVEVAHTDGEPLVEIVDQNKVIASGDGDNVEIEIPDAQLWDDEHPKLYECRVLLKKEERIVDEAVQKFGVRMLQWDSTGLFVNGKRIMLRGGCIHHDNGILGATSLPEAEKRRLQILKDAGFNAIRCSHNPASTALLEACDEMGVYVIEEMWDMWYQRKNKYDYGNQFMNYWQEDIRKVVERDSSHPCVIMYSIGNEVTEPHEERGVELGKQIKAYVKELDQTRPITIGLNMALVAMSAMGAGLYDHVDEEFVVTGSAANSTVFNETVSRNDRLVLASCKEEVDQLCAPILDAMDIAGYNYGVPRYPLDAESHPKRVVVGSETFPHQLAATWKNLDKYPYVIGDFMWTAWDYIGECSIGTWAHTEDGLCFAKPFPWKLADVGAFDLIGNPTGEALWAEAVWKGRTSIGVRPVPYPTETLARGAWRGTNAIPSWSFRGCEGKEAVVEVYTPEDKVTLFLNGKWKETKDTEDMRAVFRIPYEQGKLEAIAMSKDESRQVKVSLESAVNPKWVIHSETKQMNNGDIVFFDVSLEDKYGNVESNADEILCVEVTGGHLLGFGSGNPRTDCEFGTGVYPSHYGKALAAVRIEDQSSFQIQIIRRKEGGYRKQIIKKKQEI